MRALTRMSGGFMKKRQALNRAYAVNHTTTINLENRRGGHKDTMYRKNYAHNL